MLTQDQIKKQLARDLHLETLPAEQLEETIMLLSDQISERIAIMILEALPAELHAQYKLMRERGEEALRLFLHANIPNLETRMREEIRQVVDAYKTLVPTQSATAAHA